MWVVNPSITGSNWISSCVRSSRLRVTNLPGLKKASEQKPLLPPPMGTSKISGHVSVLKVYKQLDHLLNILLSDLL